MLTPPHPTPKETPPPQYMMFLHVFAPVCVAENASVLLVDESQGNQPGKPKIRTANKKQLFCLLHVGKCLRIKNKKKCYLL